MVINFIVKYFLFYFLVNSQNSLFIAIKPQRCYQGHPMKLELFKENRRDFLLFSTLIIKTIQILTQVWNILFPTLLFNMIKSCCINMYVWFGAEWPHFCSMIETKDIYLVLCFLNVIMYILTIFSSIQLEGRQYYAATTSATIFFIYLSFLSYKSINILILKLYVYFVQLQPY